MTKFSKHIQWPLYRKNFSFTAENFENSNFDIVSDFGFRISIFLVD
jgi:hypothetical protein